MADIASLLARRVSFPPFVVVLNWRAGQVGPLKPCVLCGKPAMCRSPAKDEPCHKQCAEAWIAAHALTQKELAELIRRATPGGRP